MASCGLMIQGCTSDAGKSMLVTAICRILVNQGFSVAPFKPQNMALNSAVTEDNGEIGRAQATQALACRIPTHTDMNPILLKPTTEVGSQVIVQGQSIGNFQATQYHALKPQLLPKALESFHRLARQYDYVVVEGAGSPAEINLRKSDIANMGFAEATDLPVILIADIDRGGVFAHLLGTIECLSDSERTRIQGFVINKFRGDPSLLASGIDWLLERTGIPTLGVIPLLKGLYLEAEDSLSQTPEPGHGQFRALVPRLPRMSNHTDFDAIALHPDVEVIFHPIEQPPPPADLIILPGSKNVISDCKALQANQWDAYLNRHLRYGGKVLGLCGGYQMLGQMIHDPDGFEGPSRSARGFGLLNCETTLKPVKQLKQVLGQLETGEAVSGYEIHMGETNGPDCANAWIHIEGRSEGAASSDDQVRGTYIHGVFDTPNALDALFRWAGFKTTTSYDHGTVIEANLVKLASHVGQHLDVSAINQILKRTRD